MDTDTSPGEQPLDPWTGPVLPHTAVPRDAEFSAVIWADIERFKPINDAHGALMGDLIISVVADAIAQASPYPAYRLGGEEYFVVLPVGRENEAASVARRIQDAVAAADRLPVHVADRMRAYAAQTPLPAYGRQSATYWAEWLDHALTQQRGIIDDIIRNITINVGVATTAQTRGDSIQAVRDAARHAMDVNRR